jgi:serine phosphatase RsbU (regulator of sigma subunit)
MGPGRERFGLTRFRDFLDGADVSDPKALVADLLANVRTFQVGRRTDDITVVALHRRASAAHELEAIRMDTVQP